MNEKSDSEAPFALAVPIGDDRGVTPSAPMAEPEITVNALPVASAAAAAAAAAPNAMTTTASSSADAPTPPMYFVEIPLGMPQLIGVTFTVNSIPLQIHDVAKDSPFLKQLEPGLYCHGISLPGIEILNIKDAVHLQSLISQNTNVTRKLICSQFTTNTDPASSHTKDTLYKHTLPAIDDLGVVFTGFPPHVINVLPASPMKGRIHMYQTVEALMIPGEPIFSLQSGGFASDKLDMRLRRSSNIPGRQLIVKDDHTLGARNARQQKQSPSFDIAGSFSNSSNWSVKRMFSSGKKR